MERIPPATAAVLRPALPGLADEMIATIGREVPGYERAMEGMFGQIVRLGVESALERFVEELAAPESGAAPAVRDTYVNLGRGEFHAGRTLEALLSAYRVGARLAWRRFVEAGVRGGVEPDVLYALGEAIFAYIDELSAESAEGYADEQTQAAGEARRRVRRLVRLLAQQPAPPAETVRNAAQDAGWPLPRRVAALIPAVGPADEDVLDAIAARLARRVGDGTIGAAAAGAAVVLVPDPDAPGARRRIEAALEDGPVALGPAVDLEGAGGSVQRALRLRALDLGTGLVTTAEHLPALLLASDPEVAAELVADRLAALDELAPGPRARLAQTLRAWLDRPGQVQAVAAELGVHPQTVRYRVRQLRELFGARLEDPDARFELSLALRAAPGASGGP